MTPFMLQKDLVQELEALFQDFKLLSPALLENKVKIFEQGLPVKSKKNDVSNFPYIIVRINEGSIGSENVCDVILIFGVYDESEERQGHKDLMNMIQDVCYKYSTERIIANKYTVIDEIEWTLQEEDIYPYYFGGIAFRVGIPKIYVQDDLI